MTKPKYYDETKTCVRCKYTFTEHSAHGNPYKYCPACRSQKFNALYIYCLKHIKPMKLQEKKA